MTASQNHKTPRVAIVIVNYKTAALILEHLSKADIEAAKYPGSQIIIVDNASPNDDAVLLQKAIDQQSFLTPIRLISSSENAGFAAGNNIALRKILRFDNQAGDDQVNDIDFDYVFLQNPDAYPHEGAFSRLVDFAEKTPKAGVAGARLEGVGQIPEVSAFRFFSITSDFISAAKTGFITKLFERSLAAPPQREGVYEVDWLCGAAVLIRREVFDDVGLLDEAYFLYYEETDFMLQAKRKGWQCWYVSDAHYTHLMGQSSGVTHGQSKEKSIPDYWFDSRRHYFKKNHGKLYTFIADIAWLTGAALFIVRSWIEGRQTKVLRQNFRRFLTHALRPSSRERSSGPGAVNT